MRILTALLMLFAPAAAFAATPRTFSELVNMTVDMLNAGAALLILATLATFLYNISSNIKDAGEAKNNLRTIIFWGVIGLFLMVSIWGILRILQTTLFGDASRLN